MVYQVRCSWNGLRDRDYPAPRTVRILGGALRRGRRRALEQSLFKRIESLLGDGFEVLQLREVGMDTARNKPRVLRREIQRLTGHRGLRAERRPSDAGTGGQKRRITI